MTAGRAAPERRGQRHDPLQDQAVCPTLALAIGGADPERPQHGLNESVDPAVVVQQQQQRDRDHRDGGPHREPQPEDRHATQVTRVRRIGRCVRSIKTRKSYRRYIST